MNSTYVWVDLKTRAKTDGGKRRSFRRQIVKTIIELNSRGIAFDAKEEKNVTMVASSKLASPFLLFSGDVGPGNPTFKKIVEILSESGYMVNCQEYRQQ